MAEKEAVSFLPYTRHQVDAADEEAVLAALRSERLAQGPLARAFEEELARITGCGSAVAVSSGTHALETALAALGVGVGDRVVVPSLTFVATANAVRARGAVPIFADVEPDTLCLSADSLEERLDDRVCGAIAVHYAGHPADVEALRKRLGPQRFLLEDAAHALGAHLHGRPVGSLGDAACFSFHPAKGVTCGEGGAVTTDGPAVAHSLRVIREHGVERDPNRFEGLGLPPEWAAEQVGPWVYEMGRWGSNFRLSELAAALGLSQLRRCQAFLERRRSLVRCYRDALSELEEIELPAERPGARSAWHLFPIRLRLEEARLGRAELYRELHRRGIGVQVHYIPVHLQPYYRHRFGCAFGDCPQAEAAYLRLLSLPLFSSMSDEEVWRVADALRQALRGRRP